MDHSLLLRNGESVLSVSDLEWAANLIFSLQNKVKAIEPLGLKEIIKTRIKRINALYKDDR
ncbi:hypothetical protein [Clostridium chromiireducens]|uniref:hypothetical protein n=1 Tax=Clostridium chromiireducens TaxID=225345 RepID=UPI001A9C13DE|nr:hypothetical protein [Clostridium chromiireducens]